MLFRLQDNLQVLLAQFNGKVFDNSPTHPPRTPFAVFQCVVRPCGARRPLLTVDPRIGQQTLQTRKAYPGKRPQTVCLTV